MKNTLSILTLMFLLADFGFAQKRIDKAQDVEVFTSKLQDRGRGQTIDRIEDITDDGYKIRLRSGSGYEYVTYNKELEVVESETEAKKETKSLKERYGEGDITRFWFNDRYFLLKGITEKENELNVFTLTELDEEGEPVAQPIELARIQGKDYYYGVGNAYLDYDISPDESKLLLSFKQPEKRDKNNDLYKIYRFMVYDKDMNQEWAEDIEFENKGGRNKYSGSKQLMNDGSIYCFSTIDRGRGASKGHRFALKLYRIKGSDITTTLKESDDTRDRWDTKVIDNDMYLFSTFGDKGDEGIVMAKWTGAEGEKVSVTKTPFGLKHVIKNQPEKEVKKWKKVADKGKPITIPYFNIHKIIKNDDGSWLVYGQEQYTVTTTSKSGYTRTTYYDLDMHFFNIAEGGKLNWSYVVPISQRTGEGAPGRGYQIKFIGSKVYVMFNDNYRNMEPEWNTSMPVSRFSSTDNPVALVCFDMKDPEAKQKRQLLWDSKSVNGVFNPHLYYSDDDIDFALVYIQGGKLKQRLVRIDFK